jgi:hypothetical protein
MIKPGGLQSCECVPLTTEMSSTVCSRWRADVHLRMRVPEITLHKRKKGLVPDTEGLENS